MHATQHTTLCPLLVVMTSSWEVNYLPLHSVNRKMVWSPAAEGCQDGPPVWSLGTRHHGDKFLLLHLQPHQGHPLALLSQTPRTSILPDRSCAMLMGYLAQHLIRWASQVALVVKKLPANSWDVRCEFDLWVGKIPWRRARHPIPVFFPGESPWTVELDRLQTIGSQRVGHSWTI